MYIVNLNQTFADHSATPGEGLLGASSPRRLQMASQSRAAVGLASPRQPDGRGDGCLGWGRRGGGAASAPSSGVALWSMSTLFSEFSLF